MSIELMLVTHDLIGQELLHSASTIIEKQDLLIHNISVTHNDKLDNVKNKIIKKLQEIPASHDILIITDLYGATPSNIVGQLPIEKRIRIVTGLNLAMLIKVFNYASSLTIDQLAEKVTSGGQKGIFICPFE